MMNVVVGFIGLGMYLFLCFIGIKTNDIVQTYKEPSKYYDTTLYNCSVINFIIISVSMILGICTFVYKMVDNRGVVSNYIIFTSWYIMCIGPVVMSVIQNILLYNMDTVELEFYIDEPKFADNIKYGEYLIITFIITTIILGLFRS